MTLSSSNVMGLVFVAIMRSMLADAQANTSGRAADVSELDTVNQLTFFDHNKIFD
jgi:hypothetical protein